MGLEIKQVKRLVVITCIAVSFLQFAGFAQKADTGSATTVWSIERANHWYNAHQWLTGANYIPATAINQLEMWQADTFDLTTIDKELGWAEGIGFNTLRVFLHSLAYKQDPAGFKKRIDAFLTVADKHHIQPLFVFFDDCWNDEAKIGMQPAPKVGIHNSGWLQDPGNRLNQSGEMALLEKYVKDILKTFGHDKRVLMWDLYNEPGNKTRGGETYILLTKVFEWARSVNPDQPLTSGIWYTPLEKMSAFQALNSDIITYHNYSNEEAHANVIGFLKTHGRPLICTEYMARTHNSRFENIMPLLRKENVGAINWGFVSGKTNTIYAWGTPMPDGSEPKEWFHDIFRKNGTPYKQEEVDLIRKLNGKQ